MLLDASAQRAGRTGRGTLTIAQQSMGLPRRRVEEMLQTVGLTPTEASRRVGNYSVGMRQRLITISPTQDGALRTDVDPTLVGKVALDAGVALNELEAAEAGLEDMVLQRTATSQRAEVT